MTTPPTPPPHGSTPSPAPPSRSTTPVILIVAAAVLLPVLVLVGWFVARDSDDDDAAGTTDPATAVDVTTEDSDGASGETTPGGVDPLGADITVSGDPLPPLDDERDDAAVGLAAPALSGTDYDGDSVSVEPGDGPTLVVFLAHWCPHCNAEIPVLNEWRDAGDIPEDLRIVGVSTAVTDERPNFPPADWLDERDWQWDVIADGAPVEELGGPPAAVHYGVSGFPFFVLLDEDGNVAARGAGEKPIEELQALVDAIAAG